MKRNRKRKIKISFGILLVILIFSLFIYGCPSGKNNTIEFYLAGIISVQSQIPVEVSIAFYSKNCTATYDSQGIITELDNFSVVGKIQKVVVLSENTFQFIIPEPYESIGGVLAWIDSNGNNLPDPSLEQVIFVKRLINGVSSLITGIVYDVGSKNFIIDYENSNGSFEQYLSIIGSNNYQFDF